MQHSVMHIQICVRAAAIIKGFPPDTGWGGSLQGRRSGLGPKRAAGPVCHGEHLCGVCLPGARRSEGSLAANVTVALWLSVRWTCSSGEEAGGWYPTCLITDDAHHTSPRKPSRRGEGDSPSEGGEKGRGGGAGTPGESVNRGLSDEAADDL